MNNIISVFDSGILSYNIGNEIIMDAVMDVINELFPNDFIVRLPFEDIDTVCRRYNRMSKISFIGGTNVLTGNIKECCQMDLNFHNILMLKNIVLLGCGWVQYQEWQPTRLTQWGYSRILSNKFIHSVRDSYTLGKCEALNNRLKFLNTGCPTLWKLTHEHIRQIDFIKRDKVVFTLTDYNHNPERDRIMLEHILLNYEQRFFFPQGTGDMTYLQDLGFKDQFLCINPRLTTFDDLLQSGCEYVGTRLHAGIRALQKKTRSFIIGIDNRSMEMSKDFGLPVIPQNEIYTLSEWINNDYGFRLNIPYDAIQAWKNQFYSKDDI